MIKPAFLVFLDWSPTPIFLNSTGVPIYWDYNSQTVEFKAFGEVSRISGLDQNGNMEASEVTLDCLMPATVSPKTVKGSDYQDRAILIWQVRLHPEKNTVIASRQFWSGQMSHHTISVTEEGALLTLTCNDRSANWNRKSTYLVNHQRQQMKYPNDNLLKYVNEYKNSTVKL